MCVNEFSSISSSNIDLNDLVQISTQDIFKEKYIKLNKITYVDY